MTYSKPARTTTNRMRIRRIRVAGLLVVIAAIAALAYRLLASSSSTATPTTDRPRSEHCVALAKVPSRVWPGIRSSRVPPNRTVAGQGGPSQHTASQDGPTITLADADVADIDRRCGQEESVVSVAAGEQLTERQALQALLLPSANNIAAVLARWDARSADRFVARMNATARSLGMTHTSYTDPSGYDDATVSTAADQVRIVDLAMRLPVFASIVATPSASLPVAGIVHKTDTLLGRDGLVGVKTGSTAAVGGCFAFRAIRLIDGKRTRSPGLCWGSPATTPIAAGLAAAHPMVDRVAGQRAVPASPQLAPAPGVLPRAHARQRAGVDAISTREEKP